MEQEETYIIGKWWHHTFTRVIAIIHKHYYFYNGTGMEYTESEGMHAVGKCPYYAFTKM